ncbi:MAG: hypothetical protein ACHQF4_09775 [Sphingobacteriales bacterium]
MTQFKLKKLSPPLIICFAFIAFVINSCRKDAKTQSLADPALNQAKTWYESTYPVAGNTRMLITRSTMPAVSSNFDFSQHIKPDWNHAKKYTRLGKNVIELPIDPSGKLASAIKNQTTGKVLNSKENSRSSFILLNDGKNYEAYVMTLLADSTYAKNHPGWASANTYQKRDLDFSGLVLYFTPNGEYVNGYLFNNGQQVIPTEQNTTTSATAKSQLTRSFRPRAQIETTYDCKAWYLLEFDQWDNIISETFLYYTDCVPNGGGGGGGGGGSASSPAPPPPDCQPGSGSPLQVVNNHSLTRIAQAPPPPGGGGDGGMPPPQPCPPQTVSVTRVDTIKATIDSLMETDSLTSAQKAQIQAILDQILNDCIGQATYNYFLKNNDKFTFDVNSNSSYPAFYNTQDNAIVVKDLSTLTPAALQEEFFHAYQNKTMPGGTGQYAGKLGSANIEFEAKLLKDISYYINPGNSGNEWAVNGDGYIQWLSAITAGGTTYPTGFTSAQLTQYFLFMGDWLNQNPGYSSDIVNSNLNPSAIFNLISSSPCSN